MGPDQAGTRVRRDERPVDVDPGQRPQHVSPLHVVRARGVQCVRGTCHTHERVGVVSRVLGAGADYVGCSVYPDASRGGEGFDRFEHSVVDLCGLRGIGFCCYAGGWADAHAEVCGVLG